LNIFCAAVATVQQVPLTRALDGLSKNDGMGFLFRAVHYLPIVSGIHGHRGNTGGLTLNFDGKIIFTRVGTYVQRGSKFCFVVVLLLGKSLVKILLYLPILFNFTMLSSLIKILHYCPISPCIQQPCPAGLTGSPDRQP
jgi:hypothetical protein